MKQSIKAGFNYLKIVAILLILMVLSFFAWIVFLLFQRSTEMDEEEAYADEYWY